MEAFFFCCLTYLVLEVIGYAAHEGAREVGTIVVADIPAEEETETVDEHLPDPRGVSLALDIWSEGGEEAIRHSAAIYSLYDFSLRNLVVHFELRLVGRVVSLVEQIDEGATDDGSAAFVAEDVAHR